MLYGMAYAGKVAWGMYQKFCNGLPYCCQEKDWKQYGVAFTRATVANWVIRNFEAFFLPMYEYFHRKILEREFAMADETPLQVLHEPERRAQTKSYMWLFRSGEDGGRRSSCINIRRPGPGIMPSIFSTASRAICCVMATADTIKFRMQSVQPAEHTSEDI